VKVFLLRWFSGDERTLGLVLGGGLAVIVFFRLDTLRGTLGVPDEAAASLAMVAVVAAVVWWSMLPRGFVWLDPAVLTWQETDRERLVTRRILGGWLRRLAALGYLLALLGAIADMPPQTTVTGAALLLATGLAALGAIRRERTSMPAEALVVLVPAAAITFTQSGQPVFIGLALSAAAGAVVLLAGSGPPTRPRIAATAGRTELVAGWRDRVLRTTGAHFLDLSMLLPAARPGRSRRLGRPVALRLAWLGVLGRARLVPTAALLALTTTAAYRTFPALPDLVVITIIGYLSVLPFGAALGELWASPGKRRWVGLSNPALRAAYLVVLTGVAAAWVLPVLAVATLGASVLYAIPIIAAGVVRTVTRKPPDFDMLGEVVTPFGVVPAVLVVQVLRGPDLILLALVFPPVTAPLALIWALLR
jgi:hypothetical protein